MYACVRWSRGTSLLVVDWVSVWFGCLGAWFLMQIWRIDSPFSGEEGGGEGLGGYFTLLD